jgi:hypothetical protein
MATAPNALTIALHEQAFNTIIRAFRAQFPRLFNYATPDLIDAIEEDVENDPKGVGTLACDKTPIIENNRRSQRHRPWPVRNLFTPVPYLPIPGYDGDEGVSYILQIGRVKVDFFPNRIIKLPKELDRELKEQRLGLELKVHMGIACPDKNKLDSFIDAIPPPGAPDPDKPDDPKKDPTTGGPFDFPKNPFPVTKIDCFHLNVYAIARVKRRVYVVDNDEELEYLSLEVTKVEIEDVTPAGFEDSMECLIYLILNFGVLPKLRTLVRDIAFAQPPFSVELTPLNNSVRFNPSVEKDQLFIFLDVKTN